MNKKMRKGLVIGSVLIGMFSLVGCQEQEDMKSVVKKSTEMNMNTIGSYEMNQTTCKHEGWEFTEIDNYEASSFTKYKGVIDNEYYEQSAYDCAVYLESVFEGIPNVKVEFVKPFETAIETWSYPRVRVKVTTDMSRHEYVMAESTSEGQVAVHELEKSVETIFENARKHDIRFREVVLVHELHTTEVTSNEYDDDLEEEENTILHRTMFGIGDGIGFVHSSRTLFDASKLLN